jgi:wobble nucleotide-excising tRNase
MIKRVKKIQKFQFFKDFSWPDDLYDFKQYNLIYGWNGSGKTTFSNFLRQIGKKVVDIDCEDFEVVMDTGIITKTNCTIHDHKIKVFNREYIEDTIFPSSGKIDPIFIIGEEDQAKIAEINSLKLDIEQQKKDSAGIEKEQNSVSREIEILCRNSARSVRSIPGGSKKYSNYECPDLRKKIETFDENSFRINILSQARIEELLVKITSTQKPLIETIVLNLPQIDKIHDQIISLSNETISSHIITRLKADSDLNLWVQKGLKLSKDRDTTLCPFCEQRISVGYIEELEQHFNDSYIIFTEKIAHLIDQIEQYKSELENKIPDSSHFYDDLSDKYNFHKTNLENVLSSYMEYFNSIQRFLEEKRMEPFKKLTFDHQKPPLNPSFSLTELNKIIQEHNARTTNFSIEIDDARSKLENHYAAEIFIEYFDLKKQIFDLSEKIRLNSEKIDASLIKIGTIEQGFLSHSEAAKSINKDLSDFLNRDEIKLSVKEYGYEITRSGEVTDRLSEGEKTAISFIYFLNSLKDKNFDISNGIVVIDDPISSFDSFSLFNAFAFLKNCCANSKQLIVLTHNFTFFNEVKRWMNNDNNSSKYMLKNQIIDGRRIAYLDKLDDLLKKYNSEYHFLFSVVYHAAHDQEMELTDCYPLPNISRRLLESFLAFRVPTTSSFFDKLEKINFDKTKKIQIYRFLNEKSHSSYISCDDHDNFSSLIETKPALINILDFIKEADSSHYEAMKTLVE